MTGASINATWIQERLRQQTALHESVGYRSSIDHFVLEHGQAFPVCAPPRTFLPWVRRPNSCFSNCLQLAIIEKLSYVEGYAVLADIALDFHHAWCLDAEGRVVDPTWETLGQLYFGVPMRPTYAEERYHAQIETGGCVGSLLDIGDDGYALVRGVETRPWKTG